MSKPGEYELPDEYDYIWVGQDGSTGFGYDDFRDATVAAVEKAHAERNCGNCEWNKPRLSRTHFTCKRCDEAIQTNLESKLKCNDWKPKEADNGQA